MTRQQRAEQLTQLLNTEGGLDEIARIYKLECDPASGPDKPDVTRAMMIDAILDKEFPPAPPSDV